jgi:hypothetical protein
LDAADGGSVVYSLDLKQQQTKLFPKWFSFVQPDAEKVPVLSASL